MRNPGTGGLRPFHQYNTILFRRPSQPRGKPIPAEKDESLLPFLALPIHDSFFQQVEADLPADILMHESIKSVTLFES